MTRPPHRLREEIARVACRFHWSHAEILDLRHDEREAYLEQLARFDAAAGHGAAG
ncbi:DUF6760 family protein [Streptomyces chrestomyceticus]|uniref:DUF6760 family protein n=1 Tax=Streptomyces chrestomyceticus TaxID=68185 RepID=UPI0019D15894|nr:DUF6760 family protein [Streptomyces chrestomyceticus]